MPRRRDSKFKASFAQKVTSVPPEASLDRTLRTQTNNQTNKCPEVKKSRTAANANKEDATVYDHIFRNFKLRRIVNHGHDINALSFFFNLGNTRHPLEFGT